MDVAVEALCKAATFTQGVLAVRDGGRAVMVGIAPAGVTAAVDITRIVRRNVRGVGMRGIGGGVMPEGNSRPGGEGAGSRNEE